MNWPTAQTSSSTCSTIPQLHGNGQKLFNLVQSHLSILVLISCSESLSCAYILKYFPYVFLTMAILRKQTTGEDVGQKRPYLLVGR
jgi:hypothetical protein